MGIEDLIGRYRDVGFDATAQEALFPLYVLFGLYFCALLGVAAVAYYRKSEQLNDPDARKSRAEIQAHYTATYPPLFVAFTVFATAFSGYTVVGVPQTTLDTGYYVLQFIAGAAAQTIALLVFFPRLRRVGVQRGYLSPTDFIADRYRSKPITVLAVIAACLPQFIYLGVQLASFGETLNTLSRGAVTKFVGVLASAVFMLSMEFLGGMHSVVLSDIVQAIIMLTGFALLLVVMYTNFDFLNLGSDQCPVQTLPDPLTQQNCRTGENYTTNETVYYGCLFAARPEVMATPAQMSAALGAPYALNFRYFWFVINFFAFPLNPHLVQRAFLAANDKGIKAVVCLLTWSPIAAMGPGIIAGIVVTSFLPFWGNEYGCGSAFGLLGAHLQATGGTFEFALVGILSAAALAAIMSSADSVILGVSNTLCIDVYRNMIKPDADSQSVVRLGLGVSLVMALCSGYLAMAINGSTFINWLNLQNGILFQLGPAVFFGLWSEVPPRAILAGMLAGLISLIPLFYLMIFGSETISGLLSAYIAAPSLAAIINFLVVFLAKCCLGSEDSTAEPTPYTETLAQRYHDGEDRLKLTDIENFMSGHVEPNRRLLTLALIILPFTVPFIQFEGRVGIMPVWAFFIAAMLMVDTFVIFLAALSWQPKQEGDEKREDLIGIEM